MAPFWPCDYRVFSHMSYALAFPLVELSWCRSTTKCTSILGCTACEQGLCHRFHALGASGHHRWPFGQMRDSAEMPIRRAAEQSSEASLISWLSNARTSHTHRLLAGPRRQAGNPLLSVPLLNKPCDSTIARLGVYKWERHSCFKHQGKMRLPEPAICISL